MKINWFSPLPPARSAVGEYTAGLLPYLRGVAEVTLWTDREGWDPALEAHAWVRPYRVEALPWAELNRADATFFHVGNSPAHHAQILRASRRHGGVVVLHDSRLQHLLAAACRTFPDLGTHREAMARYYGEPGGQAAEAYEAGLLSAAELAEQFPLTPLALEGAAAAVVHSPEVFAELCGEARCPVVYAPLPHARPAPPAADRPPGPPYRLIVLGHLGPNRRLGAVLQALAECPRRDLFRLDVYGEVYEAAALARQAERCGLADRVALHGFVPEDVLDRALASAHLAINLRYPSMGEASASQLRIWEHGLPSLVTRVGWYATLPEDVAAFVRVEREVEDVRGWLEAFAEAPEAFARMGENGRRRLGELHRPADYVAALLRAAEHAGRRPALPLAELLAERVGRELGWWTPPDADDVFARVAEEIHRLVA